MGRETGLPTRTDLPVVRLHQMQFAPSIKPVADAPNIADEPVAADLQSGAEPGGVRVKRACLGVAAEPPDAAQQLLAGEYEDIFWTTD